MVKERAMSHHIQLSLDIADEIDMVIGDERKVKQILFNLLSNAMKFTPDSGAVGIRAQTVGDEIQVAIWDTGVGIAPEDQQRVFEEFQQVGQGLTQKTGGTGLGLALTRKFIELHRGTIAVESALGSGSTFTFTLPITVEFESADAPPVTGGFPQEQVTLSATPGPRILVIEDDPKASGLFQIYLTEAGYEVSLARDGKEGLEKAKLLSPDAVILDVLLPKVDGWEVLSQLRQDPETQDLPIYVISVADQKNKGLALGATDYFVKPVQKDELLRTFAALDLGSIQRT